MSLDLMRDCTFVGPALPEPFVRFDLECELGKAGLLPKTSAAEARAFQDSWVIYRRKYRELVRGGAIRVRNHVVEPLVERLGFARLEDGTEVQTREGREDGGDLLISADGSIRLRVWCTEFDEDLDAPARRGSAYRYSHVRIAQRVLLACGERLGLVTNGTELRILISDPARPDSQIIINIDPAWKDKRSHEAPDSYRLLIALASPKGIQAVPELVEKARLQQTRVTKELRRQAREAVEAFLQEVLNHPANQEKLGELTQRPQLARELWREALIVVYRLLFILKLESTDDPARSFSFSSTSLWRNTFSPSIALPPFVRKLLDQGTPTGHFLENAVRGLFRMFVEGLDCTELHVRPLGGTLFGEKVTPLLSDLTWGEHAVAFLLDRLLWTAPKRGTGRERVHYGSLDVEDLGRVYEALLELEPGIATEPMCRLRRAKLEVVVPIAQGEKYRPAEPVAVEEPDAEEEIEEESEEEEAEEAPRRGKTKVEWIEEIQPGRFYLRVGLGRKATGSYYTPHSFVRFLVQETLGPLVNERSPKDDPRPGEILKLKVLDPAMGSGHFLVEACRFLGARLYEAARLCDERLAQYEKTAAAAQNEEIKRQAEADVVDYRQRLNSFLPPDAELLAYLPSRSPEAAESGLSQKRAEAICRRLVAIHCLYGVDKNPLAVELAKVSLWIESHSEGLPLTFLDHRLVLGDSITGPFFHHLLTYPGSKRPIEDLYTQKLPEKLTAALTEAIALVRDIESTLGATIGDVEVKQTMRQKLEAALAPFKVVAAAWAGGVMIGADCDDDAYQSFVAELAATGQIPGQLPEQSRLLQMVSKGLGRDSLPASTNEIFTLMNSEDVVPAFPYDLAFPEVFFRTADPKARTGFDTVLGNPPWDKIMPATREFFAGYDFAVLDAATSRERDTVEQRLREDESIEAAFSQYWSSFEQIKSVLDFVFHWQNVVVDGQRSGSQPDQYRYFSERAIQVLGNGGCAGLVLPSAFHANEGATGIRQLYLDHLSLARCYSFENKRKLFEIHSSFKFALIVAQKAGATQQFTCAFYLHDDAWLFSDGSDQPPLVYTRDFVRLSDPKYYSFVELRDQASVEILKTCASETSRRMEGYLAEIQVSCGEELNKTRQSRRFRPFPAPFEEKTAPDIAENEGAAVLYEGRNIWHFDDRFAWPPTYSIPLEDLSDRQDCLDLCRYYRFGYRLIASSTNERTLVGAILSPGSVTTQSISIERAVRAPRALVLELLSIWNSFTLDFLARQKVAGTVNKFLLETIPVPRFSVQVKSFLCHSALRLSSNHPGYATLWREQVGDEWREHSQALAWPVLQGDIERWDLRARMDAIIAHEYGLTDDQYRYVLSTFNLDDNPSLRIKCVDALQEVRSIGPGEFARRYDPYWDVPLNEDDPEPAIRISVPTPAEPAAQGVLGLTHGDPETPARLRKPRSSRGNGADAEGYERVRQLLSERQRIASSDVQSAFGFDAAHTRTLLKKLVEDGFAVVEGSGRATRYVARPGAAHGHTAE